MLHLWRFHALLLQIFLLKLTSVVLCGGIMTVCGLQLGGGAEDGLVGRWCLLVSSGGC